MYLGQQCTVNGVAFDFAKDGIGVNLGGIDTKAVSVTPVANTPGLTFAFPNLDPQKVGVVSFKVKVTTAAPGNKKPIKDASLNDGNGSDSVIVESLEYEGANKTTKSATLRVTKLLTSMEGNFEPVVTMSIPITALIVVTPKVETKPSFTVGFSQ